jgi:hypothetical protein
MPLLAQPALIPSKLALVNEALASLKQPPVTTLANQKPLITMLGNSVDDCVNDIYSRANWRFRLRVVPIDLVAEQEFYSIPPDFGNLYSKGITASNLFIPYVSADDYDSLAQTPYGTPGDPSGQPIVFTMRDFISFQFYPKPNASFVAVFPTLELQYLCSAEPVVNEEDSPFLPYAFKLCVVNFLKYRWMASNEYGVTDMQEAKGMYEGQLALLLTRNDPAPNGHRIRSGYRLGNGRSGESLGLDKMNPLGGWR